MQVYGFIGPSGTGKSQRAQHVAAMNEIPFLIDDGLLINQTKIVAGKSAKTEATKIASVKAAIFLSKERQNIMKLALKENNVEKLLILGTSDEMVDKIAENLGLPPIFKRIYIQDVATKEEMEEARRVRMEEGKHVVPVPTFEVKEQFSGYFIDAIVDFFRSGNRSEGEMAEKSIIRPTFSYLGKYTISDEAIKMMISYIATNTEGLVKANRINIKSRDETLDVDIDITVKFGHNIKKVVAIFASNIRENLDKYTGITAIDLDIIVKHIEV